MPTVSLDQKRRHVQVSSFELENEVVFESPGRNNAPERREQAGGDEASEPEDRGGFHLRRLYQFFATIRSITIGKSGRDSNLPSSRTRRDR